MKNGRKQALFVPRGQTVQIDALLIVAYINYIRFAWVSHLSPLLILKPLLTIYYAKSLVISLLEKEK